MPISNLTSLMESNCYVNGDKRDFFQLLDCQDDIINRFFSFLDPDDRMRMRLNKRLNRIEAESMYFIQRVELKQSDVHEVMCVIIKDREYPFDFISRIARNTSIGKLQIEFPYSDEADHKFCDVINQFRCFRELSICFWNWKRAKIMRFFLDLSRRCESLDFDNYHIINISPENLHDMYKVIVDDTTSLNFFSINELKLSTVTSFLNLLGISYNSGRVITNRNIEAYKSSFHNCDDKYFVNIVDGCARIIFKVPYIISDRDNWDFITSIEITFHKNQGAFNRFKYNTSLIERRCNGDNRDFFDLAGCPDEIIERFFSYLSMEERMKMRLNKRLNKMGGRFQYFMDYVELGDKPYFVYVDGRNYPFGFIRRIARYTSIVFLKITFPKSLKLAHELCSIIKEFKGITELSISYDLFWLGNKDNEIMTDSFFLDLLGRCVVLEFDSPDNAHLSPANLHNVYKSMNDDSVSVRRVTIPDLIKRNDLDAFLDFLEIEYRFGGIIFSSRNIEAYKDYDDDHYIINIFDGFIHIAFAGFAEEDNGQGRLNPWESRKFDIILYDDLDALNSAKSGRKGWNRIRMDVYPE